MRAKLLLASSNEGKLHEYAALAAADFSLELLPRFREFPQFPEDNPTFVENAAGKALHYSRFASDIVFADDSGLAVAALGGEPGVRSARYAGENATDAERNAKLLEAMREKRGEQRRAEFICVIAAAKAGKMLAVVSDCVEGEIADAARGVGGFGYDPLFYFAPLGKTFAELSATEKNQLSHRGKAFRKLRDALLFPAAPTSSQ